MVMQSKYQQELIIQKWEDSKLNPPSYEDDLEEENLCEECGEEAEYNVYYGVYGKLLCAECAEEEYRLEGMGVCDVCGEDCIPYLVNNDLFCQECFDLNFKLEGD